MPPVPENPKIFHITHVQNLSEIVRAGVLWSDSKRLELGFDCEVVGMSIIKERRLNQLPVKCHQHIMVGEYVPFYFCPRSIMLYILHMGNHPELTYRDGQGPIVHLVADLRATAAGRMRSGGAGPSAIGMQERVTRTSTPILTTSTRSTGTRLRRRTSATTSSRRASSRSS